MHNAIQTYAVWKSLISCTNNYCFAFSSVVLKGCPFGKFEELLYTFGPFDC